MFEKLCEIYPDFKYTDTAKPASKTFYIEDRINCSAHFIISSLLDFYLKSNDSVIFVGLQQNYGHYYSISKRIGNSLDPHLKSDALTYIDFFSSLTDWVPEDLPLTEETTIFWNSLPPKAIKLKVEKDNSESVMNELYELIQENLKTKKGNCAIVIDNLSTLLSLNVDIKSILTFYNKVQELVISSEKKPSFYFVMTPEILSLEQRKISLLLEKNCDYFFKLYPNPSGFSQDVHGQLEAIYKNTTVPKEHIFKFKLLENKVELFKYLNG